MQELKKSHCIKGKKFLLKVEVNHDLDHYPKFEKMRSKIWGEPKDTLSSPRNMSCENYFNEGTSLYIGLYVEDKDCGLKSAEELMVGFSYGFVGVKDKKLGFKSPDNLLFYSQFTGVIKEYQEYGLGICLKNFQREIIENFYGIDTITCTYDPLAGVNAYRNVHLFGMDIIDYRIAYYGNFSGSLNRADIPSDRFYVWWALKEKKERPIYELEKMINPSALAVVSARKEITVAGGPIFIETVENINLDLESEYVLVEIPYDYYRMLQETDVADGAVRRIPLDWRLGTRQAFRAYRAKGYQVVDFRCYPDSKRKRDFYVLRKAP